MLVEGDPRRLGRYGHSPIVAGRQATLRDVALPLAEHRDALAAEVARLKAQMQDVCEANREDVDGLTAMVEQERAEVARLREALAASEARAKKAGEGAAWVIARCKEALKLPACARNVRERQALGDVLAYTSAAKGAGR